MLTPPQAPPTTITITMATVMEKIVVVMVKRDRVPSRVIVMETMEQALPTNQVPGLTGQGAQQIIIMEGERMF